MVDAASGKGKKMNWAELGQDVARALPARLAEQRRNLALQAPSECMGLEERRPCPACQGGGRVSGDRCRLCLGWGTCSESVGEWYEQQMRRRWNESLCGPLDDDEVGTVKRRGPEYGRAAERLYKVSPEGAGGIR